MDNLNDPGQLEQLQTDIDELLELLVGHEIYGRLNTLEDLRVFMQHHVYAVWDFMSLLKSLQSQLTSVDLPWLPTGDGKTRYLINEIVLGEESDVDEQGNYLSHFELYLQAMEQAGCDMRPIQTLIECLNKGFDLQTSMAKAQVPPAAAKFMRFTFHCCKEEVHIRSAVFTFGREDLIPKMFLSMVDQLALAHPGQADILRYYLNRHIEVDGDHHTHLAQEMTSRLCGNDPVKWAQATEAVKEALRSRIQLWDTILLAITNK